MSSTNAYKKSPQDSNEIKLFTGRERVNCLDFHRKEGSVSLLVAGCEDRVVIWTCQLKEFSTDVTQLSDVLEFSNVLEIKTSTEVECVSWVPGTQYLRDFMGERCEQEGQLRLCFAGGDSTLYNIISDLRTTEVTPIGKHQDVIRDISVRPNSDNEELLLASVSRDQNCVIWNLEQSEVVIVLKLCSVGVSVCWHPMEPLQIMVGEKNGVITFYRIDTGESLLCLHAPSTLSSASWCPSNPFLVGAVSGAQCCLWDISVIGLPLDTRMAHLNGALQFKWSSTSDGLFSTLGLGNEIKIHHKGHKVAVMKTIPVAKAMTWHTEMGLQLLVVCSHGHLCVWHIKD